jgi:hypothetical protein
MTSTTPAAQLPTRQQLDEIDALLRRMLTLPSMDAESTPPPTVFAPSSTPIVREMPPPHSPVPGDPPVHAWRVEWPKAPEPQPPASPSVAAWGSPVPNPPVDSTPWAFNPAVTQQPPFATLAVAEGRPVTSLAPSIFPSPPLATAVRPASTSVVIGLLVLLNGTFNVMSYLLGPLGTWLRGQGRTYMGWAGVAMTLAAIGWAAGNWFGYDWPKVDLSRFGLNR